VIVTTDGARRACDGGPVNRWRASIAAAVALAAQALATSGCGQYEEAPTDLTAMPKRPDVAPPPETNLGVIVGDVRVETLAASVAVAFEKIGLYQNGKLLATSSTDGHGTFRFEKTGPGIFDDGLYELTLLSDRYRGSERIQYARFARRTYRLTATPWSPAPH
jgi:hypothetical protein